MNITKHIIKINGLNYCLTEEGRFRENWKGEFHSHNKKKKFGICDMCKKEKELTLHYHPPLSKEINNNKTELLCRLCHNMKHQSPIRTPTNKFIQKCPKGHKTYLINKNIIHCPICNKNI